MKVSNLNKFRISFRDNSLKLLSLICVYIIAPLAYRLNKAFKFNF